MKINVGTKYEGGSSVRVEDGDYEVQITDIQSTKGRVNMTFTTSKNQKVYKTFFLLEKDGKTVLKTNLYSRLKNFRDGIITSDVLGKAFEPEQRFENPDGTEIVFNRDYFGNPRGVDTIPGPFAEAEDSTKPLR